MQINHDWPNLLNRQDSVVSSSSTYAWSLDRWLEELGLPANFSIPVFEALLFFRYYMPWVNRQMALWYLKGIDFNHFCSKKVLGPPYIFMPFRRTNQIPYCLFYIKAGIGNVDRNLDKVIRWAVQRPPKTMLNIVTPKLKPLRLTYPVHVLECRYSAARDTWIDDRRLLNTLGNNAIQYIIAAPPKGWVSHEEEDNYDSVSAFYSYGVAVAIAVPLATDREDDYP